MAAGSGGVSEQDRRGTGGARRSARRTREYNEFLAIADRLAKSDPDNAVRQRDLAVSLFKVGIVLNAQNDRTKALETLRKARNIMSRLTTLAPDNAAWKKELGMFDKQIEDTKR